MELTFDELAEMKRKIEKYICVHNQKEKSYITKKNKVPNINNIFHQSFANKQLSVSPKNARNPSPRQANSVSPRFKKKEVNKEESKDKDMSLEDYIKSKDYKNLKSLPYAFLVKKTGRILRKQQNNKEALQKLFSPGVSRDQQLSKPFDFPQPEMLTKAPKQEPLKQLHEASPIEPLVKRPPPLNFGRTFLRDQSDNSLQFLFDEIIPQSNAKEEEEKIDFKNLVKMFTAPAKNEQYNDTSNKAIPIPIVSNPKQSNKQSHQESVISKSNQKDKKKEQNQEKKNRKRQFTFGTPFSPKKINRRDKSQKKSISEQIHDSQEEQRMLNVQRNKADKRYQNMMKRLNKLKETVEQQCQNRQRSQKYIKNSIHKQHLIMSAYRKHSPIKKLYDLINKKKTTKVH